MKKYKKLIGIVIIIWGVSCIAGCGGQSSKTTTTIDQTVLNKETDSEVESLKKEERTNCDVRNAKFGETLETVKMYEEGEPYESTDTLLMYEKELSGLTTAVCYDFNDKNQLYSVVYIFDEEHTDYSLYHSDYEKINKILKEKYGNPKSEDIHKSSLYEYCDDIGQALSLGQVAFVTKWELTNMTVTHVLINDNYIQHIIGYTSTKYQPTSSTSDF